MYGKLALLSLNETVVSVVPSVANSVMTVVSDGGMIEPQKFPPMDCSEWPGTTFGLFQAANVFHLAAFVVPHNFKASTLLMRSFILVGQILFMLWAAFNICAADIFTWNLALIIVNFGHTIFLTIKNWPPLVPEALKEVYSKLFQTLRLNRRQFKTLLKEAEIKYLEKGQLFAEEEVTRSDERLSILLQGKIKVTCDNAQLHYIFPNQFLDSPEWEAAENGNSDNLFQVSLIAEEKSRYLTWSRPKLKSLLIHKPFLNAVITCLIGKDITTKLYSLNEYQTTSKKARKVSGLNSKLNKLKSESAIHRSRSVDTVHTGSSGFVRSDVWLSHKPKPIAQDSTDKK